MRLAFILVSAFTIIEGIVKNLKTLPLNQNSNISIQAPRNKKDATRRRVPFLV